MTANSAVTTSAVTTRIADFAAQTRLSQLPEDVVTSARELVSVCLVSGFGAAATAEARVLHEFLAAFDETSPPLGAEGAVLGPFGRLSPLAAVTFNAACMVLGGATAPGPSSASPPGPEVVSGILAAAEIQTAAGRSLLEGVAVGAETGLRIARTIARRRPSSGWSLQGLTGRIAAGVAVVKTLGGGVDEFRQAIGLAATQAAGLECPAPSTGAALLTGRAARDGLEAGLLSLTDWKGPERPIEGDRGLLRLITGSADAADADEIIAGLGEEWILAQPAMDGAALDGTAMDGTAMDGTPMDGTATERALRLFGEKPTQGDPFLRYLRSIESEAVQGAGPTTAGSVKRP